MKSLIRWDPFRMMGRWDPFEELRSMQREMDSVFNRFLGGGEQSLSIWQPAIESYVKDGKLVLKAELPGVEVKDLDVSLTDDELVIKGERTHEREEKEQDFRYREISYGSFERRFTIPRGAKVEALKATFTNGMLEISVPVPELPKAKKIEIETKGAKSIEDKPEVKKAA